MPANHINLPLLALLHVRVILRRPSAFPFRRPDAKPSAPTSDWSFTALDKNSSDINVDNDLVPTDGDGRLSYALTSPKTVKTSSLEIEARLQRCNADLAVQMTRTKSLEEGLARVKREHSEEL